MPRDLTITLTPGEAALLIAIMAFAEGMAITSERTMLEPIAKLNPLRARVMHAWMFAIVQADEESQTQ